MAVYEEKNLTTAAAKLFLSPQGLGKIIRGLEDEFRTELFVRTKEGFIPTESGKLFYEKTQKLNKDLNDLYKSLESIGNKEKRFKIGFASGTFRALDINKIARFMDKTPEILSEWHERDNMVIQEQVENGDISFGFIVGKPKSKTLKAVEIESVEVVLYVNKNHKFAGRDKVRFDEIKNEKIVCMSDKYRIFYDVLSACQMQGFMPNIVGTVKEGKSIMELVDSNIGLGISPKLMEETDNICIVRLDGDYKWTVYGVYREDTPDAAINEELIKSLLARK